MRLRRIPPHPFYSDGIGSRPNPLPQCTHAPGRKKLGPSLYLPRIISGLGCHLLLLTRPTNPSYVKRYRNLVTRSSPAKPTADEPPEGATPFTGLDDFRHCTFRLPVRGPDLTRAVSLSRRPMPKKTSCNTCRRAYVPHWISLATPSSATCAGGSPPPLPIDTEA